MSFSLDFLEFCKNPDYNLSRKADSYVKALTYYCDFLNIDIDNIQLSDLNQIKNLETLLTTKSSDFYKDLLSYLTERRKSSYLTGGFIRASLQYLYRFYNFE